MKVHQNWDTNFRWGRGVKWKFKNSPHSPDNFFLSDAPEIFLPLPFPFPFPFFSPLQFGPFLLKHFRKNTKYS